MLQLLSLSFLSLQSLSAIAAPSIPSVPIAPGVNLPVLSLGTGSGQKGDVAEATFLWIQSGGVGIDTAFDYEDESDVAEGLQKAGKTAADVFITTKIPCTTYEKAKSAIASNLKQLQTDRVDLTLIHFDRCDELGASIAATWKALEEAKANNQSRAIGVSHFSVDEMKKLSSKPAVNQCSLSVRIHDDETIQYCRDNDITYMSFSPLCGGGNGSSCPYGSVLTIPEVIEIGQAHNVSAAQVGLKWVVQQGLPLTTAIWRQDYMQEDMDLWSWGNLTDKEMQVLSSIAKP